MYQQLLTEIRTLAFRANELTAGKLGDPRRYAATAAVIVIHLALVWIVATNILVPRVDGTGHEMQLTLPSLPAAPPAPAIDPVPEPQMQAADPTIAEAVAPQIDIDTAPSGAVQNGLADVLPPRPDAASHNESPPLPAGVSATLAQQVTLTILVDASGAVAQARVAISSGQPLLDRIAAEFARAHWHFRAATQGGQPVADWTTVIVRFLPGH